MKQANAVSAEDAHASLAGFGLHFAEFHGRCLKVVEEQFSSVVVWAL
jgi:hypothetical protein